MRRDVTQHICPPAYQANLLIALCPGSN